MASRVLPLLLAAFCAAAVVASADKQRLQYRVAGGGRQADDQTKGAQGALKQAEAAVRKGLSEETLSQILLLSEFQHQKNLDRRAKRLEDEGVEGLKVAEDFASVMLTPTYSCPVEGRMGKWGEGGAWLCVSHLGARLRKGKEPSALTFGTGCDTSFEKDVFEKLGMRSSVFDFGLSARTVDETRAMHFVNYQNAGLTGSRRLATKKVKFPKVHWVTLDSAMKEAGTEYADVLKIDCEGCEVDVVKDLTAAAALSETPPAGQVLMEIHDVADWKLNRVKDLVLNMEKTGYRLFHSEVNPYYKLHYQVSFIHESLVKPKEEAML